MILPIATTDTPQPPYWEREKGSEAASVQFSIGGELYHIEDTTGHNQRLAEGWASLPGIDWEDEDVPPALLESAVRTYAAKNPVILWDHQRDFPIGELLEWEVSEKGLFVRFRIFDSRDFDDPQSDILAKCNEVWSLTRRGKIRGLSWDGRARKRWLWSPELGKYIKQPVEILMSEITVTPIQVHPGAKITGVNTLSKALRICKALQLGAKPTGETQMSEQLKAAQAAQKAYLAALKQLPDGVELPNEMLQVEEGITKALGMDPEQPGTVPPVGTPTETTHTPPSTGTQNVEHSATDITEAITKALAPLQQQVQDNAKTLSEMRGEAAPLRNQVRHGDDASAQPRPGASQEETFHEQMSKALQLGCQVRNGKLNRGQGDSCRVSGPDLMGAYMVTNNMQLNWNEKRHIPDIDLSGLGPLMQKAQQPTN